MENEKEMNKAKELEKAVTALRYIMPILEKYDLPWCISGGFACYLYGVKRPIEAIDVDVDIDKDDPKFQSLIREVQPFTELPFQLWVDENYDNWVTDVVVGGQLLSICDTPDLKLFNVETGESELFYKNGIPDPVIMEFEGLQLPLASRESVLRMKQALVRKKDTDKIDIAVMEQIIARSRTEG